MNGNGTIDKTAAAKLPEAVGTPQVSTAADVTTGTAYLEAHWASAVG
jgi:hypothetical protein